jgi:hypothetical protein
VGAERAEAADLNPAGLTGMAAAVSTDADRLGVEVMIAAGHVG